MVVACAIPILAYCAGSYVMTGNFFLSHSGVTSLYGRTAAAVDCKTIRLSPAERKICPDAQAQAMGSDWLQFGYPSPVQADYRALPRAEVDSLITGFNRAVVTQQPVRVAGGYLRDAVKVYAVTGTPSRATRRSAAGSSRSRSRTSRRTPPSLKSTRSPGSSAAACPRSGGRRAAFLRSYQLAGGYTPGPVLLLCDAGRPRGSVIALMRRRLDEATQQLALATFLFFVMGAAILLVSDVFVFSWRYQLQALVTLVPAGALGLALLGRLLRGWRNCPAARREGRGVSGRARTVRRPLAAPLSSSRREVDDADADQHHRGAATS